jgi:hypothetical protein
MLAITASHVLSRRNTHSDSVFPEALNKTFEYIGFIVSLIARQVNISHLLSARSLCFPPVRGFR